MKSRRDLSLDAIRGLCLLFMLCNHLPYSPVQRITFHPIGLFDTAMVFVFLSGYVCAWRYGEIAVHKSVAKARVSVLRRMGRLVATHHSVATATLIAFALGVKVPLHTHYSNLPLYAQHPWRAWAREMLLLRESPLLDILKLYVLLLALLTIILPAIISRARNALVFTSAVLWAIDSFGLFPGSTESLKCTCGFFHPLAWQFVFVIGLWSGSWCLQPHQSRWRVPNSLRYAAFAAVLAEFLFRRPGANYTTPFINADLHLLFSSENVGILPLVNVLLAVVVFACIPQHWRDHVANYRLVRPLVVVGQNSLALYAIHIILVYTVELALPHWDALSAALRTEVAIIACAALFAPAYLLKSYHSWTRDGRSTFPSVPRRIPVVDGAS